MRPKASSVRAAASLSRVIGLFNIVTSTGSVAPTCASILPIAKLAFNRTCSLASCRNGRISGNASLDGGPRMPPPLVDPGPPEFRRHGNWGRRKWLHLDPKPRTSILLDTLRESPYLEGDRLESSDGPIAFMRDGFPVPL